MTKLLTMFFILMPLTVMPLTAQAQHPVSIPMELYNADDPDAYDCLKYIANNSDFQGLVQQAFSGYTQIDKMAANEQRPTIAALLFEWILATCPNDVELIFHTPGGTNAIIELYIRHEINPETGESEPVFIQLYTSELSKAVQVRTGLLVTNQCGRNPGDVIRLADTPTYIPWSRDCSDHMIAGVLSDNAHINQMGRAYLGDDDEYFLDFPRDDYMRAFPGLLLTDVTWSTEEYVVVFTDLYKGLSFLNNFTNSLNEHRFCQPTTDYPEQLCAYLVSLDNRNITTGTGNDTMMYNATATAATVGTLSTLYAAYATTVAATATLSTAVTAASLASSIPVFGWITAGVILVGTGIYSLIPQKIENITEVVVMSAPKYLRNYD